MHVAQRHARDVAPQLAVGSKRVVDVQRIDALRAGVHVPGHEMRHRVSVRILKDTVRSEHAVPGRQTVEGGIEHVKRQNSARLEHADHAAERVELILQRRQVQK